MPFRANAIGQTEPRVVGEATDYSSFLALLRLRANELKIARSHENTDAVAGLTGGYVRKLLSPNPVRRIGMISLGPVLGLLAVKLVVVVDEDALARLQMLGSTRDDMRLKVRNFNLVHDGVKHITITRRQMQKMGRKGGKLRMENMRAKGRLARMQRKAVTALNNSLTPAQRRESAKRAALIRWADVKQAALSNGSAV